MRHAIRRQRLAWAAVGLAMAAAAAGCSTVAPTQVDATGDSTTFRTQQAWFLPALEASGGLLTPGTSSLAAPLGMAMWGRPFAAGFGYPLILPQSSLWVGSGIELITGTWPYRSVLYTGL